MVLSCTDSACTVAACAPNFANCDTIVANGCEVDTRTSVANCGEMIQGLTLTVAAGKITAMSAKPSKAYDAWKARYDAAGAGKDAISIMDVGLNAAAKLKGKSVLNFVPAGTVSLFNGGDEWAGGTNKISYGNVLYIPDATLKAGDVVIVEKGELKIAAK